MGRLVYSAITSIDGFVNDADGRFEWAAPDEQVHSFVNELERPVGTYLYGRRMFETMVYWATAPTSPEEDSGASREFAELWQAADKIVYSSTLDAVGTPRTRLVREFDPDAVRALLSASARDVSVGGPGLAARAIAADLVDECHLIAMPTAVGGGTHWWPSGIRRRLELLEQCRFEAGAVHLHYRIGPPG